MGKYFKNLFSDEAGQSTTEYILILAVVVMIAMKFKEKFQVMMTTQVESLGNKIQDSMQQ